MSTQKKITYRKGIPETPSTSIAVRPEYGVYSIESVKAKNNN
jgi:hypothetical protein